MKYLFDPLVNFIGGKIWAPIEFKRITPFIERGERVLDVGAGGGWTSELISRENGADVTLLDIKDFNHTKLPIVLYDGNKMPFEDDSFDVALLLFVLHHCDDPKAVLIEAMRVSKRIIILEDTFQSKFDRVVVCANDVITNIPSFFVSKGGANFPFQFKRVAEWEALFKELGMDLEHTKREKSSIISPEQTLFMLNTSSVKRG